ncbi:partial UDP-glucose 4-epimerase, partial [Methylococcales bacterium]
IVHHNVALVPLNKSGKQFWEVNVVGSKIAAECAADAGVKAFIHMSSSAIYGIPACPVTNDTPIVPIEAYGRAKYQGELEVKSVCQAKGVDLIIIRPRTILGHGRLGIFQILFDWIKAGKKIYTIGDANHLYQFIHAHDLMDAYMLALDKNVPGAYNVGTNRFGTLREGLDAVIKHANTTAKVTPLPEGLAIGTLRLCDLLGISPLAPWHYMTYHKPLYFDTKPLEELGWTAKYSNEEMLCESYDWFVNNFDRIKAEKAGSPHRRPVREGILSLIKKFS